MAGPLDPITAPGEGLCCCQGPGLTARLRVPLQGPRVGSGRPRGLGVPQPSPGGHSGPSHQEPRCRWGQVISEGAVTGHTQATAPSLLTGLPASSLVHCPATGREQIWSGRSSAETPPVPFPDAQVGPREPGPSRAPTRTTLPLHSRLPTSGPSTVADTHWAP